MKTKNIAIILLVVAVCVATFYGQGKYSEHQTELMVREQCCKDFMNMVDCGS